MTFKQKQAQITSSAQPTRAVCPLATALLATVLLTTGAVLPASLLQHTDAASTGTTQATTSSANAQKAYTMFVQQLQKPATFAQARATLMKSIAQFDRNRASLAVLQLENAYNKHRSFADQLLSQSSVYEALEKVYEPGMTMKQAAAAVKGKTARQALQQLSDMGYRLQTVEGSFYPDIDYPAFSPLLAYVTPDIRDYMNIMATEAKAPTTDDNGIIITPTELLKRGLAIESFVNTYATSNRRADMVRQYKNIQLNIFYGALNTPVFDYDTLKMDAEFAADYRKVLASYNATQIKQSAILTNLSDLFQLLKQTNGKQTDKVTQFLKQRLGEGKPF
ncbi:hypothetical protein [Paenibacillus campi]|uniref:hypothetical protein n=1 Tax=Paenibacillus campi TaxID=3106031 RepID=UPI002AFFDA00|nr:hypothetical protein [Paenibacillus sp. SGZ-1009]